MKKRFIILAAVGILGTSSFIFASTVKTPVDVLSGLTGTAVESLEKERISGKTYGSIAAEAGKLEEFRSQMLEQKKARLDERVKDGLTTQKEADRIYDTMKRHQADCDGTGSGMLGYGHGMGLGQGQGLGYGHGMGLGQGQGLGYGHGMGRGRR